MSTFLQNLLGPALQFLTRSRDSLASLSLPVKRGIDLGAYLGPLKVLGPGFEAALATLITGGVVVIAIALARGAYAAYLKFKAGVQWW